LSKATILGGAMGNFITLGRMRHPKAERPLIDYEASTFMQSGELLGVVFGVLLNKLLPSVVIILFLIAILGFNAFKTIKKAIELRAKETAAFNKKQEATAAKEVEKEAPSSPPQFGNAGLGDDDAEEEEEGNRRVSKNSTGSSTLNPDDVQVDGLSMDPQLKDKNSGEISFWKTPEEGSSGADDRTGSKESKEKQWAEMVDKEQEEMEEDITVSDELAAIVAAESQQFPTWSWALLAAMMCFTLSYSFIKKAIQRDPNCSHVGYWMFYLTPVPVLGAFMYATAVILGRMHARKVACGYEYLPADMLWTRETLMKFPKTALMAGITAGLLGIGGGMVIGPLFLSIGMEPQVGTSSCAFMILWTAFSGVVAYGADDHLGAELACTCVAIGFVSGQLGQRGVNAILKKSGRPSYVVFLLGCIIAAATMAMTSGMGLKMIQGDYNADDHVEEGEAMFYLGSGFGCSNGH